ncbi:MAG: hypothetical protein LC650_02375 [Actinobacteria bacterium]|nr:hypothetical protein [Actinomycetota bacterium]
MAVAKTLFSAVAAGCFFMAGLITGGDITQDNEFHTECFAMEFEQDGMRGEPVDCKRGWPVSGEGVFFTHDLMMEYPEAIEAGDVARVRWTNEQAEQNDWATPASIERNGGE